MTRPARYDPHSGEVERDTDVLTPEQVAEDRRVPRNHAQRPPRPTRDLDPFWDEDHPEEGR